MARTNKPGKLSRNRYSQEYKQEALALAEKLGVKAAANPNIAQKRKAKPL